MGFEELPYAQTQAKLDVIGSILRSRVNNQSFGIGTLETPSLATLRAGAASGSSCIATATRLTETAVRSAGDTSPSLSGRFNHHGQVNPACIG